MQSCVSGGHSGGGLLWLLGKYFLHIIFLTVKGQLHLWQQRVSHECRTTGDLLCPVRPAVISFYLLKE